MLRILAMIATSTALTIGALTGRPESSAARCVGNRPCAACKDCSKCNYCHVRGGYCGVCSRTSPESH